MSGGPVTQDVWLQCFFYCFVPLFYFIFCFFPCFTSSECFHWIIHNNSHVSLVLQSFPKCKAHQHKLILAIDRSSRCKKKYSKKTENMRSIISFRTCILSKGQIYFSVQKCTYQVTVAWFPSKETAKTYVSCLLTLVWSHPFLRYAILCICDVLWIDIQAEEMGKIENDLNLFSMKSHQLRGNRDYSNNSW